MTGWIVALVVLLTYIAAGRVAASLSIRTVSAMSMEHLNYSEYFHCAGGEACNQQGKPHRVNRATFGGWMLALHVAWPAAVPIVLAYRSVRSLGTRADAYDPAVQASQRDRIARLERELNIRRTA